MQISNANTTLDQKILFIQNCNLHRAGLNDTNAASFSVKKNLGVFRFGNFGDLKLFEKFISENGI